MAKPEDPIQRSVLPIPDVTPVGLTTFDAKDPDTKYPPIRQLRPPQGAPNVLVILIDDAGCGTRAFIRPLCVRRRAPHCSVDGTITRSAWERSRSLPHPRPETTP